MTNQRPVRARTIARVHSQHLTEMFISSKHQQRHLDSNTEARELILALCVCVYVCMCVCVCVCVCVCEEENYRLAPWTAVGVGAIVAFVCWPRTYAVVIVSTALVSSHMQ